MTEEELEARILVILRLEGRALTWKEVLERLPGQDGDTIQEVLWDMAGNRKLSVGWEARPTEEWPGVKYSVVVFSGAGLS